MPFKEWRQLCALKAGLNQSAFDKRLYRGYWPYPEVRKVNARVIFVVLPLTSKPFWEAGRKKA